MMPVAVAAPASLRDWLTTCIGANVKTVNTCRTINNAEGVGGPSSEYNLRKQMSNVPYIAATSTSKEIEAPQDDEPCCDGAFNPLSEAASVKPVEGRRDPAAPGAVAAAPTSAAAGADPLPAPLAQYLTNIKHIPNAKAPKQNHVSACCRCWACAAGAEARCAPVWPRS